MLPRDGSNRVLYVLLKLVGVAKELIRRYEFLWS